MNVDRFEDHVNGIITRARDIRKMRSISPKYQEDKFADWRGTKMIEFLMDKVAQKFHSLCTGVRERDTTLLEDLDRLTIDTLNYLLFLNAALHEEWERKHTLNREPLRDGFGVDQSPTPERGIIGFDTANVEYVDGNIIVWVKEDSTQVLVKREV